MLWKPGSCDSPVSKVLESRWVTHLLKAKKSPVSKEPASHFTVCVNLQAHATAFKSTLILKVMLTNTNTFNLCLQKFHSPRIFGRLPGFLSTGELFLKSNNSMKSEKIKAALWDILNRTRMTWLRKKPEQKILWDCPFKILSMIKLGNYCQ